MIIEHTRFGMIEYTAEDVISFVEGLIGFQHCKQFLLINAKPDSAFRWLQSLDEPGLAFLVVNPRAYVQDYQPELCVSTLSDLQLREDTPMVVFTTATIPPGRPEDMTLNLLAPIVVNPITNMAAQVVLEDAAYTMKHRVFDHTDLVRQDAAA